MLQGTLADFSLADVFQLLALTRKTGVLRLSHDADRGSVFFREGKIYDAVADAGRLTLARRLVGAGLVEPRHLHRALEEQAASRGLGLGRVLLDDGRIDDETLQRFVHEQIQDAVFHLMRWEGGSFSFAVDGDDHGLERLEDATLAAEAVVAEGVRRLEEWEEVRRRVPSADTVLAMAATPRGDGSEVQIRPAEWRVLTLVDGRRTVQQLVLASGQGEFQTFKVLHGMLASGLLEARETGGDTGPASVDEQADLLRRLEGSDADEAPSRADAQQRAEAGGPAGNGAAVGPAPAVRQRRPDAPTGAPRPRPATPPSAGQRVPGTGSEAEQRRPAAEERPRDSEPRRPRADAPRPAPERSEQRPAAAAPTRPRVTPDAPAGAEPPRPGPTLDDPAETEAPRPRLRPDAPAASASSSEEAGRMEAGNGSSGAAPGRRHEAHGAEGGSSQTEDARVSADTGKDRPVPSAKPERQLTTDPEIDDDIIRRVIEGVEGL